MPFRFILQIFNIPSWWWEWEKIQAREALFRRGNLGSKAFCGNSMREEKDFLYASLSVPAFILYFCSQLWSNQSFCLKMQSWGVFCCAPTAGPEDSPSEVWARGLSVQLLFISGRPICWGLSRSWGLGSRRWYTVPRSVVLHIGNSRPRR